MIGQNESYSAKEIPTSYLTCMFYILEGWTGVEHLEEYFSYLVYLTWLFTPLLIAFILPVVIVLLLYTSIIILHIYKRRTDLKEAYLNDFWDGARETVATLWCVHARIWNGFKLLLDVFTVLRGTREECLRELKNGNLLAIAPGGVREALFSNEYYTLMWENRKGFAQVAIEGKVPIIPMFTQNVRESIRSLGGPKLLRLMYEYLRLPLVPLYGNFPVKLRTYIGDPIPYDPNISAEELAEKAKMALQCLIEKHQKTPGNVFRALMERFQRQKKEG